MDDNEAVEVDDVVTLGTGISEEERVEVVAALAPLADRLGALDRSTLALEAWVKNRGDDDQTIYLARRSTGVDLVAHDQSPDFHASLLTARDDLRRQLSDHHDRQTKRR